MWKTGEYKKGTEMRPYRGKRIDNREWVYGWYVKLHCCSDGKSYFIHIIDGGFDDDDRHEVHPDSVGQQTGVQDKNKKEIYVGDLVRLDTPQNVYHPTRVKEIIFSQRFAQFCVKPCTSISGWKSVEIIGNIHDNPKLLENIK